MSRTGGGCEQVSEARELHPEVNKRQGAAGRAGGTRGSPWGTSTPPLESKASQTGHFLVCGRWRSTEAKSSRRAVPVREAASGRGTRGRDRGAWPRSRAGEASHLPGHLFATGRALPGTGTAGGLGGREAAARAGLCRQGGLAGGWRGQGVSGAASAFRAASGVNKRGRRPALGSGETRPLGAGCWPRHGAGGSQQGPLPSTGTDPAARGAPGLASGASWAGAASRRAAGPPCAAQMSCRQPGAPGCCLASPRLPRGAGGSLLPAPCVLEGKLPSLSTAAAPCAVPPPGTGSWGGSWGSLRAARAPAGLRSRGGWAGVHLPSRGGSSRAVPWCGRIGQICCTK